MASGVNSINESRNNQKTSINGNGENRHPRQGEAKAAMAKSIGEEGEETGRGGINDSKPWRNWRRATGNRYMLAAAPYVWQQSGIISEKPLQQRSAAK